MKPCTTVIEVYEAEGTLEGFCLCDGRGNTIFQLCEAGTIFNPNRGVCMPTANVSILRDFKTKQIKSFPFIVPFHIYF